MNTLALGLLSGFFMLMLTGCDGEDGSSGAAQRKTDESAVAVPGFVQAMADKEFPADGEIHVQSVGTIEIKPETPVCYFPQGFFANPSQLFAALRQKKSLSSGSRLSPAVKGRCEFSDDVVLMNGKLPDNLANGSYKLTLMVWQGDTAWVGVMEKQVDPSDPKTWGRRRKGFLPKIDDAIVVWIDEIQTRFIIDLLQDTLSDQSEFQKRKQELEDHLVYLYGEDE